MVEQADQKGATSGAAPATAADFASLQRRIEQLGAAVSQATNGLKLYRSEEDIIERIRKRFIYALGIVAVLSFFGIQAIAYVIIDQQWGKEFDKSVIEVNRATAKTEVTTAQATKAASEASNAASEARDAVKKAQKNVDAAVLESKGATAKATEAAEDARKKAEDVTGRFDEIDERITQAIAKVESEIAGASGSVRAAADKSITDIQLQLTNIQDQINAVSGGAKGLDVAGLQSIQQKLRDEAEKARKLFAANGQFFVEFHPIGKEFIVDANKLSRDMTRKGGFKAIAMTYSGIKNLAETEPPRGRKRSDDKIATIMTLKDSHVTMAQISEVKEILNEAGLDYIVRQVVACQIQYTIDEGYGCLGYEFSRIIIFLSAWPLKLYTR